MQIILVFFSPALQSSVTLEYEKKCFFKYKVETANNTLNWFNKFILPKSAII